MRRFLLALPAVAVLALGVIALSACRGPGFRTDGRAGAGVFIEAGPRYGIGAEVKIPSIEIGPGSVAHPITGEAPPGDPAPAVERPFTPAPPLAPTSDARPKVCIPGDPGCDLPGPEPVSGDFVHRVETPIVLLDARPEATPDAVLVCDPAPPAPNVLADEYVGKPWIAFDNTDRCANSAQVLDVFAVAGEIGPAPVATAKPFPVFGLLLLAAGFIVLLAGWLIFRAPADPSDPGQ